VSFINGTPGPCYLKNELRPIVQNSNIWGGRRISDCIANPLKLHKKRVVHAKRNSKPLVKRDPFGPDFTFVAGPSTSTVVSSVFVGRATS